MAGIFPTNLDQVNDFSYKAGDRVIDLLGKQPEQNVFQALADVVGKASQAIESEKMANAVASFRKAFENGASYEDAIKNLDSRIIGSDQFQERADRVRNSILAQRNEDRNEAKWQNELKQQAMAKEASLLAAEFQNFKKQVPNGDAIWIQENLSRLKSNPFAYNTIMGMASDDLYLPDGTQYVGAPSLTQDEVRNAFNILKNREDFLNTRGVFSPDSENNFTFKNVEDFIDKLSKRYGYTEGAAERFDGNVRKAVASLADLGAPAELVLAGLARNIDWSLIGTQDIDTDTARQWIKTRLPDYQENRNTMDAIKQQQKILKDALDNNTVKQVNASLSVELARLKGLKDQGIITQGQFNSLEERAYRNSQAALATLTNAVMDADIYKY